MDRRPSVLIVSIVSLLLASIFVVLRFVSRLVFARRLAWHDRLILLAWLLDLGFCLALFYATSQGLGLHDPDIPDVHRSRLNRANYVFTVLYNPSLMAVKSSILAFYLTLARGEKPFRWATYATLVVVNAAGLALTLVNVFQCSPVGAAFASPPSPHARCSDILTLYLSSSPVNIVTDLAILVLPMPILTQMRLPRRQKIILVVTFSGGFFVAVVDVIRIAYLQNASTERQVALKELHLQDASGDDFNWYASLSFMWSVVEVNISIACACVPSLKPLVARLVPKLLRGSNPSDPPTTAAAATTSLCRSDDRPVDIHEFLAGEASLTVPTTSASEPQTIAFFDFVNLKTPTSMLKLSNRESIAPVALTTVLFFLWGFAYGLLDILNAQFQRIVRLDAWRSIGLHAVYFGGYLLGPLLLGRLVLTRAGFKGTFITGLCIYACGTLIFWPSAVLTSYSAFAVSNFIAGVGLAVLETAANPFIALCGPLENAEIRLNLSQGVQAIGSVVSPLLARKVLFRNVTDVAALVRVQWTYLGIALFDVLLALAFYYLPIPEASDEDLQQLADRRRDENHAPVLGVPVVWLTLGLAVASQFFYVAGQEVLSLSFTTLVGAALPPGSSLNSFDYLTIGRAVFAVGRFLAALLQAFLKPRWILLLAYVGMVITAGLCMTTRGYAAVAMGLLVFLFESGAFSIIFVIGLRGTARHTKTAATLLTTAIGGGSCFPFVQFAAQRADGVASSYSVLVALFAAGAVFPLYLNLVPAARKQVDPVPGETLRRPRRRCSRPLENPSVGGVYSRRRSVLADDTSPPSKKEGGIMHDLAPWPET
ncbi:hypothetical protein EYZ11_009842 [Aspergillus tanneri]|uniref:Rhodopsin domain-containing protein n=1 Tax=Aspergillus tanneri TaxID=1220188 RepID=A0A4S3J753_9EURO|nr:uncharacterized protein ATNIH1004_005068 [Aspergillus tanneri]KAA8649173.1 hypothetical protein ATNIH1004_005068 [Aspergillus tanneri]THC90705.1 hypothetical protein EYZ11_009842 [Aspergillus tanneri]